MAKHSSFLKNLTQGISSVGDKVFHNPYSKIGMSWFSHRYIKYFSGTGVHHHQMFNSRTSFYGIEEYFHGLHEIFVDEIYRQNLPANAYVIDCGAHIGLSVIYIKRLCPTAQVIAFEPDEKNYELLNNNVKSHELKDVELRKEAVWIEDTELNFIQDGSMSSKIGPENGHPVLKVKAIRLKSLLTKTIDFLKLDIEGAEYDVIKDIADELKWVSNMFIEYHGNIKETSRLTEILNIIQNAGFAFYIKEALSVKHPFVDFAISKPFDVQLNIFCLKTSL
jgi:FkbM family methyltransferase